ncbi:MAG: DUF362 domain-containing protein [Methylacidiphilales bacterium]|nr:DUF362 domain-containing protein [Candidatus Methylacidiphilales bacterium]
MPALIAIYFLALATAIFAQEAAPSGLANPPAPAVVAPAAPPPPRTLSPVIWTEHPEVVQRFGVDGPAVRQMVDNALLKLTSAQNLGAAWTRLGITPQDVVGIKITTMGGPLLSTHRAILQAICDGLEEAGVPPTHIIIWDKDANDMEDAGYTPTPSSESHVGIASIFPGTGYDPNAIYKNGLLGTLIWGDSEFVRRSDEDILQAANDAVKNRAYGGNYSGGLGADDPLTSGSIPQTSNRSHFARLVSTLCTKIINVPVLTDNSYIGINGCLGSLALASIDNNRRFQGDPTYGDPAICEILSDDLIRRKVVVHILDALIAQYAGGPRFDPQFTKSIGAIYVSRDPVAIDSLVLKRMEQWRASDRQGRIDPIGKTASHVQSAASYNLGTDDPSRIQLLRLP